MQYTRLKNGHEIPLIGFGTYKIDDPALAVQTVQTALSAGYRLLDTAAFYGNEEFVGQALRQSGLKRKDVFLSSKVWNDCHGYDETLHAFDTSLQKLGTDYLDLYLIHWPKDKNVQTWQALETLYKEGRVKAIGVSNFKEHHLDEIMQSADITPMVNQVEFHPLFQQKTLKAYCQRLDIKLEAWSPLMRGEALKPAVIGTLAKKYGKTPSQIVLRWDIQHDVIPLPKSSHLSRMKENLGVFDFELSEADMAQIDALDQGKHLGADPDNVNF